MSIVNIDIGIPTHRRPEQLRLLLEKTERLDLPDNFSLTIIIVDNDPLGSAKEVAERGHAARFPVRYICERQKGLAFVRNRIIEATTGDYLVMIDDDEYPAPSWISELVVVAEEEGCDAVIGKVVEVLPDKMPVWLRQIHTKDTVADRSKMNGGYTSNVLLRVSCLRRLDLRFDQCFNTMGGEDTDFFERLSRSGGHIRFSAYGYVYAPIDELRISLRWYAKRNLRVGAANSIIYYRRKSGVYRVVIRAARGAVGTIVLLCGVVTFTVHNRIGFLLIQTGLRNIGHGLVIFGLKTQEYA